MVTTVSSGTFFKNDMIFFCSELIMFTCFYSLASEDIFNWRGQEHLRARVDPVSGSTNKLTLENEPLSTQAGKDAKLNSLALSKFPVIVIALSDYPVSLDRTKR